MEARKVNKLKILVARLFHIPIFMGMDMHGNYVYHGDTVREAGSPPENQKQYTLSINDKWNAAGRSDLLHEGDIKKLVRTEYWLVQTNNKFANQSVFHCKTPIYKLPR